MSDAIDLLKLNAENPQFGGMPVSPDDTCEILAYIAALQAAVKDLSSHIVDQAERDIGRECRKSDLPAAYHRAQRLIGRDNA